MKVLACFYLTEHYSFVSSAYMRLLEGCRKLTWHFSCKVWLLCLRIHLHFG
jgi:hypothetical protein